MKKQSFLLSTRRMGLTIATTFFSLTMFISVSTAQNVNRSKSLSFEDAHSGDSFGNLANHSQVGPEDNIHGGEIVAQQVSLHNSALHGQRNLLSDPGNVAVVDALYKAFAKGDIPTVLAGMDPNIAWNEAEGFPYADRNPYIGPQAVLEGVFARIGAEWEYWNLTGVELHEMANNKVFATLRYQAKYKKNGATIDNQTAHLWTLKDGKITSFQQFTDTKQVADAIIR